MLNKIMRSNSFYYLSTCLNNLQEKEVMVKNMKKLDNPFIVQEYIIMKNIEQLFYYLKDQVSELVNLIIRLNSNNPTNKKLIFR